MNARGQALGLVAGGTVLIAPDGTTTELGSMPDGSLAVGVALNDQGDVVGYAESSSGRGAIRYHAGGWEVLPGISGIWSTAAAIDASGRVVGTWGASDNTVHAFLWENGKTKSLPLAADLSSSALVALGDRIAGVMQVGSGTHAFVLGADGTLSDLGTLGGSSSNPFAMNAGGTVVGGAHDAQGVVGAFVWKPGSTMQPLGVPQGARASEARGIDDAGHVLGNVIDTDGVAHGVYFDTGAGSIRDLPLPPDDAGNSFVVARVVTVLPDGRTLGMAQTNGGDAPLHCVLWSPL